MDIVFAASVLAVGLMCVLNILAPFAAFRATRKAPRLRILWHALAFMFILSSPLTIESLIMPDTMPDEAAIMGLAVLLLPLIWEAVAVLVCYSVVLLCLAFAVLWVRSQTLYRSFVLKQSD